MKHDSHDGSHDGSHDYGTIRRLHEHRAWFRAKMIASAEKLSPRDLRQSFPMGPGSVFAVLVHCWAAETAWINALEESDPGFVLPGPDSFASLDALLDEWKKTDARWDAYWARLKESDLAKPVVRVREGKAYTTSVADVLIHVCTHQMYHAAQLKNMLRQLEVTDLPPSDFIVFARETWRPERAPERVVEREARRR
jgi:uncharacterized damage-inducible protein DinB